MSFWITVVIVLGAYHGLNPAMGWLYGTALALKQQSRKTLYLSLIAITIGHFLAIILSFTLYTLLQTYLYYWYLQVTCAALLVGWGIYHLIKPGHPKWFGFKVGTIGIGLWSFIIATVHGAGLMLIPFVTSPEHIIRYHKLGMAIGIHMIAFFLVTSAISILIYEIVSASILKKAWINFDILWAIMLIVTGVFILF